MTSKCCGRCTWPDCGCGDPVLQQVERFSRVRRLICSWFGHKLTKDSEMPIEVCERCDYWRGVTT